MKKVIMILTACVAVLAACFTVQAGGVNVYVIRSYDDPVLLNPEILHYEDGHFVIDGFGEFPEVYIGISEWPEGYTKEEPYVMEVGFPEWGYYPYLMSFTVPEYVTFVQTGRFFSIGGEYGRPTVTVDGTYILQNSELNQTDMQVNGTLITEGGMLDDVTVSKDAVFDGGNISCFVNRLTVEEGGTFSGCLWVTESVVFQNGSFVKAPEDRALDFSIREDGYVEFEEGAEISRDSSVYSSGGTIRFNGQTFAGLSGDHIEGQVTVDHYNANIVSEDVCVLSDLDITCLEYFDVYCPAVEITDCKIVADSVSFYPREDFMPQQEEDPENTEDDTEEIEEEEEEKAPVVLRNTVVDTDCFGASCRVRLEGECEISSQTLDGSPSEGEEITVIAADDSVLIAGSFWMVDSIELCDRARLAFSYSADDEDVEITVSEDAGILVPEELIWYDGYGEILGDGTIFLIGEDAALYTEAGVVTDHELPVPHIADEIRIEQIDACEHEKEYHFTPRQHWLQCSECGIRDEMEEHEAEEELITEADCLNPGVTHVWCETCGYDAFPLSPALGHERVLISQESVSDPEPVILLHCRCSRCDEEYDEQLYERAFEQVMYSIPESGFVNLIMDERLGCDRICELYKEGKLVDTITVPADEYHRFSMEEDGFDEIRVTFTIEDEEIYGPVNFEFKEDKE